jgi:2'-5' RNA ligase
MRTIRSFIAIPLAPDLHRGAARLIHRLKTPDDGIKWVPTDNLHLTLKFLGDVDNTEVPAVCEVIRSVARQFEPFELEFSGAGGFPAIDRPRVLWAGVRDQSGALCRLVSQLETELAELRFKPEPRDYRPHLTLGRTRGGSRRASESVVQRLQQNEQVELGTMIAEEVCLIASFLDKRGPSYQVMDTVGL